METINDKYIICYDLYQIDTTFLSFLRNDYTDRSIVLNVKNPQLKIDIVSKKCNVEVYYDNNKIVSGKRDIEKVLYGISENRSIDVTKKIIKYLDKKGILDMSININKIISDPFPTIKKNYLFILIIQICHK